MTFLDYFIYFSFFAQFFALFASQITMMFHEFYGIGVYINAIFVLLQFGCGGICFEWIYSKLHNHTIDVQQWVKGCEAENEKNYKLSHGLPIDDVGINSAHDHQTAAKAKRVSYFDLLIKRGKAAEALEQAEFASFGAASVVGAMLNQSKQRAMEKSKISEKDEKKKVCVVWKCDCCRCLGLWVCMNAECRND